MKYNEYFSVKETPQSTPIPGKDMVENNAGGYAFESSDLDKLDRFLVLGTEGGTYYVNEQKLTVDAAKGITELIGQHGKVVVDRVVEISDQGRAAKNTPALFVLSICTSPAIADTETRRAAFDALPKVARTGTHLFQFVDFMNSMRGWGKLAKESIQDWYQAKKPENLEYQMVKYRQRVGWTHNDVLRLAKPVPATREHDQLYEFAKNGAIEGEHNFRLIEGLSEIQKACTVDEAVKCISDYRLPMEAVPTEFKNKPQVWEALLPHLPITATIRNLRNMAKCGFLVPMSEASKIVADRISNEGLIRRMRVHPMQYLNAILNYPVGAMRTDRLGYGGISTDNSSTWLVSPNVVDALNEGFQLGFQNVKPTGLRTMQALDVSGSMGWRWCVGSNGITPREASAALALITVNVEPNYMVGVFSKEFKPFDSIKKGMYVGDAIKAVSDIPFGSTDLAAPMMWSIENNVPVDVINCYTDNETWHGRIHPCQALEKHRQKFGINTKFAAIAMEATKFTVADPKDPGMLDVVGFDTATPSVLSEFARM